MDFVSAFTRSLRAALQRADAADRRSRAIRDLQAMPDYMLRDIGIDRADIRHRV